MLSQRIGGRGNSNKVTQGLLPPVWVSPVSLLCLSLHHIGMAWAALFLVILVYLHPRPSGTLWEGTKSHRVLRRVNSAKVTQGLLHQVWVSPVSLLCLFLHHFGMV